MAIPEGYTALAKLGYADKGNYSASTTYMEQDAVYYNGSSWVCKVDNTKGVTPAEGNNWHYLARGFAAETAAEITATDTNNILGSGANKTGPLQTLLNKITDFIVNRAISNDNFVAKLSERLVNNGTTNQAGFALDARFGKSLQDQVSVLNDSADFSSVSLQNDVDNTLKLFQEMPQSGIKTFVLTGLNNRMGLTAEMGVGGTCAYLLIKDHDYGTVIACTNIGIKGRLYTNGELSAWI